jgi:hypothetical protein
LHLRQLNSLKTVTMPHTNILAVVSAAKDRLKDRLPSDCSIVAARYILKPREQLEAYLRKPYATNKDFYNRVAAVRDQFEACSEQCGFVAAALKGTDEICDRVMWTKDVITVMREVLFAVRQARQATAAEKKEKERREMEIMMSSGDPNEVMNEMCIGVVNDLELLKQKTYTEGGLEDVDDVRGQIVEIISKVNKLKRYASSPEAGNELNKRQRVDDGASPSSAADN